jgi:hypothetical protein
VEYLRVPLVSPVQQLHQNRNDREEMYRERRYKACHLQRDVSAQGKAGWHVVGTASDTGMVVPGEDQDYVDPNGLEIGRENEHGCSTEREIHYDAQSVCENLVEMGGRGSGST